MSATSATMTSGHANGVVGPSGRGRMAGPDGTFPLVCAAFCASGSISATVRSYAPDSTSRISPKALWPRRKVRGLERLDVVDPESRLHVHGWIAGARWILNVNPSEVATTARRRNVSAAIGRADATPVRRSWISMGVSTTR